MTTKQHTKTHRTMTQVVIENIRYNVIDRKTPEQVAESAPNAANLMLENGIEEHVILQRPRGKKTYLTTVVSGRYTSPVTLF